MASRKETLKKQAKKLGLSEKGTVAQLAARVSEAEKKLSKEVLEPVVTTNVDEYVVESKNTGCTEEISLPEGEEEEPPVVAKEVDTVPEEIVPPVNLSTKSVVSEAVITPEAEKLITRTALKTKVKFVGRPYLLEKGQPFTGPKEVVEALVKAGCLEKE